MCFESLFFELLQVAIGNRRSLSCAPSREQWAELFSLSGNHALVAVAFKGVKQDNLPERLYLQWLGFAAKVAQKNKEISLSCASLCKDLTHDGLYSCILKGQSNLIYYPEDLRECRTPGDIDVWCGLMDPEGLDIPVADADGRGAHFEKYQGERGVIEWVLADYRIKDKKMPEVNYHHVDWEYKGIECEVHFKPSWMNCPWHNRRLQEWCMENEQWNTCEYGGFNIPSASFNVVYQLVHIYRHLFNEGIGLRQLLDYYFVLRAFHIEQRELSDRTDKMQQWANAIGKSVPSNDEVMRTLKHIGVDKFAGAVMYVLQKVLDPPKSSLSMEDFSDWQTRWPWMLCAPDAKRGEFLLNEIMLAGNFGKYDSRNVISANEGYLKRFVRRQKRFLRFLTQYPSEVIWGPYFTVKQRVWRMWHGWR